MDKDPPEGPLSKIGVGVLGGRGDGWHTILSFDKDPPEGPLSIYCVGVLGCRGDGWHTILGGGDGVVTCCACTRGIFSRLFTQELSESESESDNGRALKS